MWLGVALAVAPLGCTNDETASSLVDLAASTSGGLVQILVSAWLTDVASQQDPDLAAPIAEQQR
jgi:hypothetical protein